MIGTYISYGIAWYRVWRAHFTGLGQTLPNTKGNLNMCCNLEKNLIFSNMYTDLLSKIEEASERIRTTRVKRSAFYCVEEGVLRSGKKRNFYSCIFATSGAQGV